jgi:hypothetical protein
LPPPRTRLVAVSAVAAGLALLLGIRAWAAGRIATPWILVDELIYADLARSLADEGRLAVRGEALATSVVYPALIAPAWLADNMDATYRLAKWINVLAMSAVAVPVFLWARRLAGTRAGLVAAGLTLLLPAFVYTGSLLTENLFLPLFVGFAYALARALESPSPRAWLAALAIVVLAVATRLQGLVLLPVVVTAAVLFALLDSRARDRPLVRTLRPLAGWVALPAAALLVVAVSRSVPGLSLDPYEGLFEPAGYAVTELARWSAANAGAVALAGGVLPAIAFGILAARAFRAPALASRAERAFVAVAVSSAAWLIGLAGVASNWNPVGIRERYALHVVPLLLVALVVWVARGAPRPRLATALAAALPVGLIASMPLRTIFGSGSFLGDSFSLIVFWRLARVLPGEVDTARALLVAGAVGAALLFALVPRRAAGAVLPALVAAFLAGSSAAVFATARSQSRGVALASGQADRPAWIDAAVGDRRVVFLNTIQAEAAEWVPVWQAEFWNRSFAGVVDLGATEPSPLPQREAQLGPGGRVLGLDARYVLVRSGVAVAGELLAESGGLRLYRADLPLRLVGSRY